MKEYFYFRNVKTTRKSSYLDPILSLFDDRKIKRGVLIHPAQITGYQAVLSDEEIKIGDCILLDVSTRPDGPDDVRSGAQNFNIFFPALFNSNWRSYALKVTALGGDKIEYDGITLTVPDDHAWVESLKPFDRAPYSMAQIFLTHLKVNHFFLKAYF